MRFSIVLSYLLIYALVPTLALAQGSFQVSPGKLFFKQQGGQQGNQNVLVANNSQQTMVIRCHFSDWVRDSLGNKKYATAGTLPFSNSNFLKVVPEIVTLKPGESKYVEVSLNVPISNDTSFSNSMLFLTQIDEKKVEEKSQKKQAMMKFLLEMGVHIYNEPPQLRFKNVEIESVRYLQRKDTSVSFNKKIQRKDTTFTHIREIRGRIKNNGELIAEGNVRYELTHKTNAQEVKLEPVPFNSMPGDQLVIIKSVPNDVPPGKYVLVMLLDIGMDQPLKVGESEIEIY